MKENEVPWYAENGGVFTPDYFEGRTENIKEVTGPEQTKLEVDFLEKVLELQPGVKILDMPCGNGRHSLMLAERGYDVTGQDLNGPFLEQARERAKTLGVAPRFVHGDMRSSKFVEEFDVAINMWTALGYFNSDCEDRMVLAGIFKVLRYGGMFVLDFMNQSWLLRNYQEIGSWGDHNGTFWISKRRFDPATSRNYEIRIEVKPNGERNFVESNLRIYTPAELVKMAQSVGFKFLEMYGDFHGGKWTMDSRRVILIFEKP